jgi:hypothetical protein
MTRLLILSACIALAVIGAFAGVGPAAIGFGLATAALALSAPTPLHLLSSHPRSIFETRRAGLA